MKRRDQNGSILVLVTGFVLPLLFLLMSATIDVQAYLNRVEELQSIADDAALVGARYLPDREAAKLMVGSFLENRAQGASYSIVTTPDLVTLTVSRSFSPFFADIFGVILNSQIVMPYNAESKARAAPLDVYIAVDRSEYLSPALAVDASGTWGEAGQWGAADIFTSRLQIPFGATSLDPTIATQQCFNPHFSSVKRAAVRTFDFFSSFQLNRVGVHYFPGAVAPLGRTRELNEGLDADKKLTFFDTHLDWDSDQYVTVEEQESPESFPVQSTYCASVAESEPFFEQYRVPDPPRYMEITPQSEALVNQNSWTINPDYPLTVREKIWSRVINKGDQMDFSVVINAMSQSLFQSGQHKDRGGLVNHAGQVAFVISDRPPQINGLRFEYNGDAASIELHHSLHRLGSHKEEQSTKFSLYYLMIGGTQAEAQELSDLFSQEKLIGKTGEVLFDPKVIRVEDPELSLSKIVSSIVLEQRSHAISQ